MKKLKVNYVYNIAILNRYLKPKGFLLCYIDEKGARWEKLHDFYILSENGTLIGHPDSKDIMKFAKENFSLDNSAIFECDGQIEELVLAAESALDNNFVSSEATHKEFNYE